jgi:hypothetical protein
MNVKCIRYCTISAALHKFEAFISKAFALLASVKIAAIHSLGGEGKEPEMDFLNGNFSRGFWT